MKYITITDSIRLRRFYAGGYTGSPKAGSGTRLMKWRDVGINIIVGPNLTSLRDGRLDYPIEFLKQIF